MNLFENLQYLNETKYNDEIYFTIEKDKFYEPEDEDCAIAIYKYYVFNPNGDGDGYVEVSEFDNGMWQFEEDIDDAFNVPLGTLASLLPDRFEQQYTKKDIESEINNAFKIYVNTYLNNNIKHI